MNGLFSGIPGSDDWKKVIPVTKGWSNDQKFYVEMLDRRKFLLRISDISNFDRRQSEYEALKEWYSSNIAMPEPIDFGICNKERNVYTLLTWLEGDEAGRVLPKFSREERYKLGYFAGRTLKLIHQNPVPNERPSWSEIFNQKTDQKIKAYKNCGIKIGNADKIIDYINVNRYLLDQRTQTAQHGDYHCGNMVINEDHKMSIVDFDRLDYGDPWEEFNRITWSADISPIFATGQIDGYFCDSVPDSFFRLMALYIAVNQLSSIPWAIQFGQSEVNVMLDQSKKVLDAYDQFQSVIPKWYKVRG
ncbi:aminoglycoside phosphotransferase family protein [Sporolactobacillus pectinivorans]|uniref:aminoglycoside phosphotransferase family protein n=1 Tax=Sporolactobacillus pectinivorans TaxID=1591408 RepID=UPI000C259A57|nr:phosphotransferase [Sporolactobacillus pectinivorans]